MVLLGKFVLVGKDPVTTKDIPASKLLRCCREQPLSHFLSVMKKPGFSERICTGEDPRGTKKVGGIAEPLY